MDLMHLLDLHFVFLQHHDSCFLFCCCAPDYPSVCTGTSSLSLLFFISSPRIPEAAGTPWGRVLQRDRRQPRGDAVAVPRAARPHLCQDHACPLQHHRGPWNKHGWPGWRPTGSVGLSCVTNTNTQHFLSFCFSWVFFFFFFAIKPQQSEAGDLSSSYVLHVYLYCFSCIGMSAARLGL